ncbi:FAD-dependent oxidoreductase [uncultured Desulfosarcina sp.]|uniref:FAD-dependent oxidoreductase n=1 Tax=uncultured Desulfosarcina sp. TaxID=218289 RepID=UPI0029C9A998|nr:FAD-dependent oxidoreductase [uncultured Desulfosarcina sp.]
MAITAILFMGGLGFTLAAVLAAASRLFHVDEDPRLAAIKSVLPGLNCGACGYAGCEGAAKALLAGRASVTVCAAGGMDVIDGLMRLTGKGGGIVELPVATVHCFGPARMAPLFLYQGPADCRAAAMLYGGWNGCESGCLGGGTCASVCPFHAIRPGADRLPRIDPDRCRGCGRCADACPRGVIRMETLSDRLLHLDRTSDCLAPCRQKCPAQINVPVFVGHLIRGEREKALLTIKMRNPFPLVVGRTCPHPCENICRRNIADEGVAIGHLQRYLGEWERQSGRRIPMACLPDTGRRVAVVGSGPAGLSCAYFLRRLGHRPTVFEARCDPGGMLRYGIPAYRLPRHIVDWEIRGILELGVEIRTQAALGRDFTLTALRHEGYEAIFLGLGAWTIPPLCVSGEAAEGVWQSLDFLAAVGVGDLRNLKHKQVVVIGESNTAMDCARCSIRLGAGAVSVICPRDRQEVSARKRDVTRAEAEGVCIRFMTRPVRILAEPSGRVEGVICQHVMPDPDASPKQDCYFPIPGSDTRIDADLVIVACERKPDLECLLEGEDAAIGFKTTPATTLAADDITLMAAAPDIFAAGDMHTGRATVVGAVAGGRRAARSIHHLITNGEIPVPGNLHRRVNPRSILKGITTAPGPPRVALKELPVAVRTRSFTEEVVATLTDRQAHREAQRCLQCGTCCYAYPNDFPPAGFPSG